MEGGREERMRVKKTNYYILKGYIIYSKIDKININLTKF